MIRAAVCLLVCFFIAAWLLLLGLAALRLIRDGRPGPDSPMLHREEWTA